MSSLSVTDVGPSNRHYINIMRGASILRVVLAHLGLSWFFMPYSSYIGAFLPLLFFVSGAVSYFSYLRAKSTISFFYKRMLSLLVPYYVLMIAILVLSFVLFTEWRMPNFWGWLLVAPSTLGLPFSLGQVWFIQTLALITIGTLPVYYFATTRKSALIVAWLFSLGAIVINSFWELHPALVVFGKIDLYLAVSNAFFFLSGSLYYNFEKKFQSKWFWMVSLALIALGLFLNARTDDFSLGRHMESPDLIYVMCATGVIGVVLSVKKYALRLLAYLKPIERLLMFSSKHAYAIFLLHTVVLGFIEKYVFTTPLTDNIVAALARLFMVLIITLILAPSLTRACNYVSDWLKSFKFSSKTTQEKMPV